MISSNIKPTIRKSDLIFPELSYTIIGCAFDVYSELGPGHHEKFYQRAMHEAFNEKKLFHHEQVHFPLLYHGKVIGKSYFDFLVDSKIIVELKKGDAYSKKHIEQVSEYLKMSNLSLAILINFGMNGVKFKRVVNTIESIK